MPDPSEKLEARATKYVNAHDMRLKQELGHGKDGMVYGTDFGTAVKVFVHSAAFKRELLCYQRLRERGIDQVLGHTVPLLIQFDADNMIIEMSVVEVPYLLDFASAYLDYPPDFSAEVLEERENERRELFGANWSKVKILIHFLEDQYEIFLMDVHPGNISFAK